MTNHQKVSLGAPSLTGQDNNTLVKEAFANETYPLTLILTSHVPVPLVFGDVGVALGGNSSDFKTGSFVFRDSDQLNRFATDIEMVCELNGWVKAITVELPETTQQTSRVDTKADIETQATMENTKNDVQEPQSAPALSSETPKTPTPVKPNKTSKGTTSKKSQDDSGLEQKGESA